MSIGVGFSKAVGAPEGFGKQHNPAVRQLLDSSCMHLNVCYSMH
jgi:hypothetical protein